MTYRNLYSDLINKIGKKDKYSFADISYVSGAPIEKVKKEYAKGIKKIERIVRLWEILDDIPDENIVLKISNINVVNILVANLRQRFPLKQISEANIHITTPVLLWLLTHDYKTLRCIFRINLNQHKEIVRLIQRS